MSLAAAVWMFIIYWGAAAKGAGPSKSSESKASRALHERLLYGSLLLLFVPVPGLRERYLPMAPYIVAIGLTLETGSALLAVWARRHLDRNWSGAISVTVDHELVSSGPYRLVRHPIYTGMLGMFIGTAVVSGELHALIAVALISVAYWRKIRLEEQSLREIFETAYDVYRRRTWSLIPWVF